MSDKIFICVCGREFYDAQKFNSHKSHCSEHYINKYGDLAEYESHKKAKQLAAKEALQKKAEIEKHIKLDNWLSAEHLCERCGKVMTEKFGSGRFCSRACANAREHSEDTKEKIRNALIKPEELKKKSARQNSARIFKPKDTCIVCGKVLLANHSTPYCQQHYNEYKRKMRLEHWLSTGDTGLDVDTTIRGIFRDYILEQQNCCCAICGMRNEWNGKPLSFVLDHINGDASYSARENLRLICPNCDSQLDTFKSKNKNSARTKRKQFMREVRDLNT